MQHDIQRPSIIRIAYTDLAAAIGVGESVLCLALLITVAAFGQFDLSPGIFFAVIPCIGIPIAIWRTRLIRGICAEGIEVPATITSPILVHVLGLVHYRYQYEGKTYSRVDFISSFGLWRLELGRWRLDSATVVVHRQKPGRAVVSSILSLVWPAKLGQVLHRCITQGEWDMLPLACAMQTLTQQLVQSQKAVFLRSAASRRMRLSPCHDSDRALRDIPTGRDSSGTRTNERG